MAKFKVGDVVLLKGDEVLGAVPEEARVMEVVEEDPVWYMVLQLSDANGGPWRIRHFRGPDREVRPLVFQTPARLLVAGGQES